MGGEAANGGWRGAGGVLSKAKAMVGAAGRCGALCAGLPALVCQHQHYSPPGGQSPAITAGTSPLLPTPIMPSCKQAPASAVCFRVAVAKWLVLVRLLLGEVPERSEFTAPDVAYTLAPYFDVTQAVRGGDLAAFRWAELSGSGVGQGCMPQLHCGPPTLSSPPNPAAHPPFSGGSRVAAQHDAVFRADRTHNLIVRLRHNVIRAGLRRISLAYSRISLADVAAKLGLPSVQDTESIVAKTIRCVSRG